MCEAFFFVRIVILHAIQSLIKQQHNDTQWRERKERGGDRTDLRTGWFLFFSQYSCYQSIIHLGNKFMSI